jgi:hypothetical protein
MTPDLERFLDLATRPLDAEPGMRDEAKGELMGRVSHTGVPHEMLDLRVPLERLETSPPRKPWPRRVALLAALVVSIVTFGGGSAILGRDYALMSMATMLTFMRNFGGSPSNVENPLLLEHVRKNAPGLPLGRDLMSEDHDRDDAEAWLAEHPDDLAMVQEKVTRKLRISTTWSGLEEPEKSTIARLDPDNALWPLMQVVPHIDKAISSSSRYSMPPGAPPVTDEAEFQNALRLFSEAAAKSSYTDRSLSLKRRQIDAFPPSRSLADDLIVTGFAGIVSPPFENYSSSLGSLAVVQCDRLATAGDKEGLVKFFNEWKQLVNLITNPANPTEAEHNGVVYQFEQMCSSFDDAFDKLGMAVEKAELEEQQEWLAGTRHSLSSAPAEVEAAAGARVSSTSLLPRDLTVDQLIPSRRTELAFFDRSMGLFLAFLALIFTGLVGLESCRRSRIVKGMARGLIPLFRKEDHLWIAGLGLAFPWLWWWAFTRISPLGLRDLKFDEWYVLTWVLQPIAGFIFGMVMLLQTARWRWAKQGGFLCLGGSLPWLGWGIAALAGLALPASGILRYLTLNDDETGIFLIGVFSMSACGLLWLLWEGIMNLFTPRSSALRPNLVMRALLPWALVGVLTLMASVAVSTKMERHWFLKDPLLPTWTSKTHLNALEERVAAERQASMRIR